MESSRGISKTVLIAATIVLLAGAVYSYNANSETYSPSFTEVQDSKRLNLKEQTWNSYFTELEKLGNMFPVDIRYKTWNEFKIFESNLKKTGKNYDTYYDPEVQWVWIQDSFTGTLIRVTVYKHETMTSFTAQLNTWIKETK